VGNKSGTTTFTTIILDQKTRAPDQNLTEGVFIPLRGGLFLVPVLCGYSVQSPSKRGD
jgi:hypothetical protein